jgi:hypothetical protein
MTAKQRNHAGNAKQPTRAKNATRLTHAKSAEKTEPRKLTAALLREMPLPPIDGDDDKEERGRVLVIGGSTMVPGAMLLAGVAVLRAVRRQAATRDRARGGHTAWILRARGDGDRAAGFQ